ncbi:uroporphyrinogen-III synthase [Sphingobium sp. AN558]|uniref:uroporphyrinogen-III synthase n=1 Tax=Sphingobium sp. AN558 TaxID=3133442 RepID=UPI0030C39BFE
MSQVIILRPQPAAGRTAARVAALGLCPLVHPLFAPQPLDWTPPPTEDFDAVLLTSANGVRLAGPGIGRYRSLPTYAVGEATALALVQAGFADVTAGTADGSMIAARIARDGHRAILHLGGRHVAPLDPGPLRIDRIAVYAMNEAPQAAALPATIEPGDILLIHSPRAGERAAALLSPLARETLHIVAISPAAALAAGDGWASVQSSAQPQDDAMLALAARLCK